MRVLKMLSFLSVYFFLVMSFWLAIDSFFAGSRFELCCTGILAFLAGLFVLLSIALFCLSLGVAIGEYKVKSKFAKLLSVCYCLFCVLSCIVLAFIV